MSQQNNNVSENVYTIDATRKTSQFNQMQQTMRCHILEAHRGYFVVESLKRYNQKYPNSNKARLGLYTGMPVRRINRDQVSVILDESTGKILSWETVRRREGTSRSPGRARGGR